jgi:hypothetical protein
MKHLLENPFYKLLKLSRKFKTKNARLSNSSCVNKDDISYSEIKLYDSTSIDTICWPNSEEGDFAKRILTPFIKNGLHHYIDNVHTELKLLKMGDLILPLTINQEEYDNSYVCSPYGYYISYALESIDIITNKALRKLIRGTLLNLGAILRWSKFNKVIMVNNWPFSTNLHPPLEGSKLNEITKYLIKQFPHHTIVFRSIDAYLNQNLCEYFKKIGFKLIASRQIYFTNANDPTIFETRLFKSDLKLLKKSDYEVIDIKTSSLSERERMLELYQSLYINKYSTLNPKLNTHFIQIAIDQQIMQFKALKKDGKIDGVIGYLQRHGIMFSPFFGYDAEKPPEAGLYRLLSTLLMLEAQKNKIIFHQSSGASFYKKIRKAEGHLEYTAIYNRHLPYLRRLPWVLIKSISNSIGVYFMKKY